MVLDRSSCARTPGVQTRILALVVHMCISMCKGVCRLVKYGSDENAAWKRIAGQRYLASRQILLTLDLAYWCAAGVLDLNQ